MNTYDHIIFDELAQQRPVHLPEVGYLKVENRPAEISNDRSVSAPRNVVVFTQEAPENVRNAVEILAAGAGEQSAWDQYNAWLDESRKDDKLVIDGVGTLENGVFSPTYLLDKVLNPNSPGTVAVKPRKKGWLWALVSILILAALILLGLRYCGDGKKAKPTKPATTTPAKVVETPPATATQTGTNAAKPENKSGLGFPVDGRHYVVGGVFDIPANADNYIAYIKRTYPQLTPEKFSYPGVRPGRTMVTVFSSTDRKEALNLRRQLDWDYGFYDFWLWPEEK